MTIVCENTPEEGGNDQANNKQLKEIEEEESTPVECQQRTVEDSPASPTVDNPSQKRKKTRRRWNQINRKQERNQKENRKNRSDLVRLGRKQREKQ